MPETITRRQHIQEVWNGIQHGRIPEERIQEDLDQHVLDNHGVLPELLPGWQVVGVREVYSSSSTEVQEDRPTRERFGPKSNLHLTVPAHLDVSETEMIHTDPNSGGQSSHTEPRPGGQ